MNEGLYFRDKDSDTEWIKIRAARHRHYNSFGFSVYEYRLNNRIYQSLTDTFILDFNGFCMWAKLSG